MRQAIAALATGLKQFDLSTDRAAVEIHLHGTCHEVTPVTRQPSRFAELDFFASRMVHSLPTAKAVQFSLHFRTSVLFSHHNTGAP